MRKASRRFCLGNRLDHCRPVGAALLLLPTVTRPGPLIAPALAAGLTLGAALLVGCDRPPHGPVTLLADPVPVIATVVAGEDPPIYRIEIRGPDRAYEVRSLADPDLDPDPDPDAAARRPRSTAEEAREAALRRLLRWDAPYLFVREDNGGGNAWRADVDHVFRFEAGKLHRLGTVSARFGAPGSQRQGDRFLDLYDRLEFTPLTSHAQAPGFTLVMADRDGRFEVRIDETWDRAAADFAAWREDLRAAAKGPSVPRTESERREVRGTALRCLALARYCRRDPEYRECLELARKALGTLDEVEEAVGQVVPGELAPSLEEVFRLHPGLINVFRETPAPESGDVAPAAAPLGLGGSR